MPVTQRIPMKESHLSHAVAYVQKSEKCDYGYLVSGIHCTPEFAYEEFEMNRRFWKDKNTRAGYHIMQSFDYRDEVDPKTAHEIGVKLVNKLYPNYQCVVATHIDKGHIHNHIVLSSMNLHGRKLVDKLSHPTESLYALREVSDELAQEYGYRVLGYSPKIGSFEKSKTYQSIQKNWRKEIREKIDTYKLESHTLDELLERLSNDGYIIQNRGKYLSLKPFGMKRFVRLYKLGQGYSEQDLKEYFYKKFKERVVVEEFQYKSQSEFDQAFYEDADTCRKMLYFSQRGLSDDNSYPKYFTSRAFELKKFERLKHEMAFIQKENISCYEDIIQAIQETEMQYEQKKEEYQKLQTKNETMQSSLKLAEVVVMYHQEYLIYKETKEMFSDAQMSDEVKQYVEAKALLGEEDINTVREYVVETNKMKRDTNQAMAELSFLKQRLTNFNNLKASALSHKKHYIKGMSFHKNMIDENRSKNKYYCVKLPYTNYYVYLEKECVVWNNYDVRADMYLVDDKKYTLYDSNDQKVSEVEGEELEKISIEEKEQVSNYYAQK